MDDSNWSRKDIGNLGERIAADYLLRHGFRITARNIAWKTGELDIVARKLGTLHIIEVKSSMCDTLPCSGSSNPLAMATYHPAYNLHRNKIRKVARTAEWYAAQIAWNGDLQVDAVLVWLRRTDMRAKVRYLPQVL